jgi:hypothetical protein
VRVAISQRARSAPAPLTNSRKDLLKDLPTEAALSALNNPGGEGGMDDEDDGEDEEEDEVRSILKSTVTPTRH